MTGTIRQPRHPWLALAGFLLLTLAVGVLAGVATEPDVAGWYRTLAKPDFNPPNWVFAPVWTTLYILMAVAAWRVWRKAGLKSAAMTLFWGQLALNCAWSFVFFHFHQVALALCNIVALLTAIALTAAAFRRIDRPAALLFVPYIAWVAFATLLNAAIYRLN